MLKKLVSSSASSLFFIACACDIFMCQSGRTNLRSTLALRRVCGHWFSGSVTVSATWRWRGRFPVSWELDKPPRETPRDYYSSRRGSPESFESWICHVFWKVGILSVSKSRCQRQVLAVIYKKEACFCDYRYREWCISFPLASYLTKMEPLELGPRQTN